MFGPTLQWDPITLRSSKEHGSCLGFMFPSFHPVAIWISGSPQECLWWISFPPKSLRITQKSVNIQENPSTSRNQTSPDRVRSPELLWYLQPRRSQVVTWGSSDSGGDCGALKEQLQNVLEIQATESWRGAGLGSLELGTGCCAKHMKNWCVYLIWSENMLISIVYIERYRVYQAVLGPCWTGWKFRTCKNQL